MKLAELNPERTTTSSYLFVGPQGVGKTIAALSFPKPRWYDNESKLESVLAWYQRDEYKSHFDDIDYVSVPNIFDFANDTLTDILDRGPGDRQTLVFDSISNASRDIVQAVLAARRKVKGGGDRAKVIPGGLILPSWDEFDAEDIVLGQILSTLFTIQKRWKVNVVCIAHPHTTMGPSGKSATKIVAKGHKAPQTVLNYFQEIYHFERDVDINGGSKRVAVTNSGDFSRTGWYFLPDKLDFTDESFYDVLNSHLIAHKGELNGVENVSVSEVLPK